MSIANVGLSAAALLMAIVVGAWIAELRHEAQIVSGAAASKTDAASSVTVPAPTAAAATAVPVPRRNDQVARTIDWDDLLPADERGKPIDLPRPVHGKLGENAAIPAQLRGGKVNHELNGQRVRLPGYLVPLELDQRGYVREMLIAPYVGACIHVPAPPPNQIVYVALDEPVQITLYDAYWVTGRMTVSTTKTAMATTGYSLHAEHIELYAPPPDSGPTGP